MPRDYSNFEIFLNELISDIYTQPEDPGHGELTLNILNKWLPKILGNKTVIDMGCGQIAPQDVFERNGMAYTGVAIGEDVIVAKAQGKNVLNMDMTFTEFGDESFDMVYSRHSLEHSPFPLLTLMEWHRVAKFHLLLVLPSPAAYGYVGKNHYGVMNNEQARFFLERVGWQVIWDDVSERSELRYFCAKTKRHEI